VSEDPKEREPGPRTLSLESAEAVFDRIFGAGGRLWTPAGLAALWLGIDAARGILGTEGAISP